MFIYFVRHGQTPGNAERRHQTPSTPLSAEGEIQAGKVAERLKDLEINAIWTSPMRRAQHTAEIINQYHQLPIIEKPDLREVKRATVVEGKLYSDPSLEHLKKRMVEHEDDPFFKLEDGESFAELSERAKKVIQDLEKHAKGTSENEILCVTTHGLVLSTILANILVGKYGEPKHVLETLKHFRIENTGISIVSTHETIWKVITLNDFAHL
jgi:phosphoserine phosphatase